MEGSVGLCMGVQGLPVVMTKLMVSWVQVMSWDCHGWTVVDGEALQVHGGLGLWLCGAMLRL